MSEKNRIDPIRAWREANPDWKEQLSEAGRQRFADPAEREKVSNTLAATNAAQLRREAPAVPHIGGSHRELRELYVRDLKVAREYQRDLKPDWARKTSEEFDPDAFGVLLVSKRADGQHYVFDGQHRLEMLKVMGWHEQLVDCMVYEGMSIEDEAQAFLMHNSSRKPTPFDRFRAALVAGEPEAVAIADILKRHRLDLSPGGGWAPDGNRPVCAVSTLSTIMKNYGPEMLNSVLDISCAIWPSDADALTAPMLNGLALFAVTFRDDLDHKRLMVSMRRHAAGVILSRAKQRHVAVGGLLPVSVKAVLVSVYNGGREKDRLVMEE